MKSFTTAELSNILKGQLIGNGQQRITGLGNLTTAASEQITFIGSSKYARLWPSCGASAAIVNASLSLTPVDNRPFILVTDADLAMARLLELFLPETPVFEEEIHPTAVIHPTVILGNGCKVGAGCYIGKDVVIGEGTVLFPNVTIFDESSIGSHTTIWSGTVIRERTQIGENCILHTNVSIGADGFGYRQREDRKGLVKIPHIGNVIIGNWVEIGANSCVDRAKFNATIIGDGCKIDNLVQIGHNSIMGRSCIMAGGSGLAGSVTLGDGVVIGGSASIKDHTTIHSGAVVGAGSGVMNDVPAGKTVLGYPACDSREMLRQWVALRKLGKV